jgi:hypothetical protein
MVFINPTPLTLTLEYALFGHDGTFFGCDRDTLSPNGRTRYTMEASNRVVNSPPGSARIRLTEGTLKSILFVPAASPAYGTDGALQAGLEIHVGGGQRTPISADAARVVLEASCSGLRGRHLLSTCSGDLPRALVAIDGPGKWHSSAERPPIDTQGGDARRQGRGFHTKQFRRAAGSEDLSAGLLQSAYDDFAFLPLQFISRDQRGLHCRLRLLVIFARLRGW